MKDGKSSSEFTIKSLMKDRPITRPVASANTIDHLPTPVLMTPPMVNSLTTNQIVFNMALSSLHEKFIDSLRHRGSRLFPQNHPVYAGALASSLPGFMAHPMSSGLSGPTKMEMMHERHSHPSWISAMNKRHHSSLGQSALDYPHTVLSLQKPKRIRTAFSAGQLVQLEASFDNNAYVVGQERRDLASGLGLTETQVKVWFQNRRTKQKRGKAEIEEGIIVINE